MASLQIPNPEGPRQREILEGVLRVSAAISCSFGLILLLRSWRHFFTFSAPFIVITGVAYTILRAGHVRRSAQVFSAGFLGIICILIPFNGGLNASLTYFIAILLPLLGRTVGPGAVKKMVVLLISVFTIYFYMHLNGHIPTPKIPPSSFNKWAANLAVILGLGYAVITLTNSHILALNEAQSAINVQIAQNKELHKAWHQANAASIAQASFLANISHELRTPLNGIIGMSELLLDTPMNAEQSDFSQTINMCSKTLLHLVNEVLDFSKVRAGHLELEIQDFNLHQRVKALIRPHVFAAQAKGLALISTIGQDIPHHLRGDAGRIEQVLNNLLSNAVKFTQKGKIILHIERLNENHKTVTIGFSVADTGIGIHKDVLTKIFDPFTQADVSTTRKYGGTGLGLAISHELVTLMNGQLTVKSEPKQGATFSFTVAFNKQKFETSE